MTVTSSLFTEAGPGQGSEGSQPESALHGSGRLRHLTDLAPCALGAAFFSAEVPRWGQRELHVLNLSAPDEPSRQLPSRNLPSCCCPHEKPIEATPQDFWESEMTQGHVAMQDPDFGYELPPATFQGHDYTLGTSCTRPPFPEMPGRRSVNIFAAAEVPPTADWPGDCQMASSPSGGHQVVLTRRHQHLNQPSCLPARLRRLMMGGRNTPRMAWALRLRTPTNSCSTTGLPCPWRRGRSAK